MEDLAKKRRKYLLSRTGTTTAGCVGFAIAVGAGIATILSLFGLISSLVYFPVLGPMWLVGSLVTTMVTSFFTYAGVRIIMNADKAEKATPYVPPVHKQIATLPADKVLLRGADLPASGPGELLRSAYAAAETEAEQLLRADLKVAE